MGNYEGNKGELLIKEAVYRIDTNSGQLALVIDELKKPNGLCFSPDYKRLYVVDTGAPGGVTVWDLVDGKKLQNKRPFVSMSLKTDKGVLLGGTDGVRADIDGNIWASAGWGGEGRGLQLKEQVRESWLRGCAVAELRGHTRLATPQPRNLATTHHAAPTPSSRQESTDWRRAASGSGPRSR